MLYGPETVSFSVLPFCKVSLSLKAHLRLKSLYSPEDVIWTVSVFHCLVDFRKTRRLFHYTIWWHFILAPEVWGVFDFFSCTDYGHSMGSSLNLSRDGKRSFVVGWCWKSDSGLGCLSLSGEVTEAHMQPETKWEARTMDKIAASGVRPSGFKFLLCMHQLCDLGQVIQLIFLTCKMRPVT